MRYLAAMDGNFADLAPEGRVSKRVYTDSDVFRAEMDRIYGRTWLFVAHESQIRDPGDFVTAHIGDRPVIVARHADGRVHVFANRCTHRGMRVCAARRGSKRQFICPYHGWTFGTDGRLVAIPRERGYGGRLGPGDPDLDLTPAARVESYRGFVFASRSADGPPLAEHLGEMSHAIDNMVDRAPSGSLEMAAGGFRQQYAGNWKLHMENANDLMHASITHVSSIESAREVTGRLDGEEEHHALQMFKGNGLPLSLMDRVEIHGFARGHSFMGGFYTEGAITQKADAPGVAEDPVNAAYAAAMEKAHGAERAREITGWDTFNHLIYPNLVLNPKHQQMRLMQPVAADRTIVHSACFRLVGAPEEMHARAVSFLNALNSPASQITSDDIAVFNGIQKALGEADTEWIDLSRGLGTDRPRNTGESVGEVGTSELPLRAQYAAWRAFMAQP